MEYNNGEDATRSVFVPVVGMTISHYRLLSRIGAGGMGEVFLAHDTNLNRNVAIKFLPQTLASNEEFRHRFDREAQAAAALNHPNIITIHEVAEDKSHVFIVMEYVDGTPLGSMIRSRTLTIEMTLDLAVQICSGLAEAHRRKIVHRDIKPGNILVDRSGRVRVLDFGLAKAVGDLELTQAGTVLGTANYMAPEQAVGEDTDIRSDIFSVGVVLYEMLTGVSPFKRDNVPATLHAIVHEPIPPLPRDLIDALPKIQPIINMAMAKQRHQRYQSVDDLIADLQNIRDERPARIPFQTTIIAAEAAATRVKSLAVLHLRNLGAPDDEFLSYGITEDLIIDLTRIGSLRVSPMRSILKYKNSTEDINQIAAQLHVDMILDGSIRKENSHIRVSVELIDVHSGNNLWADRWEESQDKLPHIKQSLAQGISHALGLTSSMVNAVQVGQPEAKKAEAYEKYLRGKYTFEYKKDTSDINEALKYYREALNEEPTLLAARAGIAEIFIHQGDYELANMELSAALADAQDEHQRAEEASILLLLTQSNANLSKWDEAWMFGNQAYQISKELSDLAGEAAALGCLIDILVRRAKFDEAMVLFEHAMRIFKQLDDQYRACEGLKNMGVVHMRRGEHQRARKLIDQALRIARRRKNSAMEAACVGDLGVSFLLTGDHDEALVHLEEALRIDTIIDNLPAKATWLNNIAVVYYLQSNYRRAIPYLEEAAKIKRQLGDLAEYALYSNNVAETLTIIGECDRAISLSNEALKIGEDLNYPLVVFNAHDTLGHAYFCRGKQDVAEEHYKKALDAASQVGLKRNIANVHANLAQLYFAIGAYEQCIRHCKEGIDSALAATERDAEIKSKIFLTAAQLFMHTGESSLDDLRKSVRLAQELDDTRNALMAQRLLAIAVLKQDKSKAAKHEVRQILRGALETAREKEIAFEVHSMRNLLTELDQSS